MKTILPDSNVLLSFFTDRNLPQQEEANRLFELARRGEAQILLHQNVLVETVYVLRNLYRQGDPRIATLLSELLNFPGMNAVQDLEWSEVLRIWPSLVPDFGDAIVAGAAKALGASVMTFDRDFLKRLRKLGLPCAERAGQF